MTRVEQLYNHHRQPVGTATWNKRNSTVSVVYDNKIYYPDTTLQFDEFDEYVARRDLTKETDLQQITLTDLL